MTTLLQWLDIKHSEQSATKYLFFITLFFAICSSISRSIGMTLLVGQQGESILPTVFVAIDLFVMLGSIIYTRITEQRTASQLFKLLTTLLAAILLLFSVFFIWLQNQLIFASFFILFSALQILMFIHLTSFISSYFSSIQLRRTFPVILSGFALGGIIGGFSIVIFSPYFPPQTLLLLTILPLWLMHKNTHQLEQQVAPLTRQTKQQKTSFAKSISQSFDFIKTSSLMLWLTVSVLLFMLAGRLLEYYYQGIIYPQTFPDLSDRAHFFGQYEMLANLLSLTIQLTVSRWIITRFGVAQSNMIYPFLTLVAGIALFIAPTLLFGIMAHFINQELRQSIRSPANNLYFNAIPSHFWSGCKAYLNGIVYPIATCLAAALIYLINQYNNTSSYIPIFIAIFSFISIFITLKMGLAYKSALFQQLSGNMSQQLETPEKTVRKLLTTSNWPKQIQALNLITQLKLSSLLYHVGKVGLNTHHKPLKEACIKTLASFDQNPVSITYLLKLLRYETNPTSLTLLVSTFSKIPSPQSDTVILPLLKHPCPSVFTAAAAYFSQRYEYTNITSEQLEQSFHIRLQSASESVTIKLLPFIRHLPEQNKSILFEALCSEHSLVKVTALSVLLSAGYSTAEQHEQQLYQLLASHSLEVRQIALSLILEINHIPSWQPILQQLSHRDLTLDKSILNLCRLHIQPTTPLVFERLQQGNIEPYTSAQLLELIYPRLDQTEKAQLNTTGRQQFSTLLTMQDTSNHLNTDIIGFNLAIVLTASHLNLEQFEFILVDLCSGKPALIGHALETLSQNNKATALLNFIQFFEHYILTNQPQQGALFLSKHSQW